MAKIQLCAFSDESNNSFQGQVDALKRNGLTYMELRSVDDKSVAELTIEEAQAYAKRLQEEGLEVWSIGSPLGKIRITDDIEQYYQTVEHVCKIANVFGTKRIRMFSFYDAFEERDKVMEYLTKTVKIGEKYGVQMCHENEKHIYGDTVERVEDVLLSVKGLKQIYDPANFLQVGESADKTLERLHATVEYFHVKDCIQETDEIVPAGYGDGKFDELVARITKDTVLSVEPHLAIFKGYDKLDATPLKGKFIYESNEAAFDAAVKAIKDVLVKAGYQKTGVNTWEK